jgi:hypothetical protein
MDANDLVMEECRATWRAEAHARAVKEAEAAGLDPDDSSEQVRGFIKSRTEAHYSALEKLGLENIQ